MKVLLPFLSLSAPTLPAQAPEGIWQGYDGEWVHVSQQLIALAEATPAEKFSWRPAAGARSTSEVYMHIVTANFGLLGVIGLKAPADMSENMEKTVTSKAEVIAWLKRSLDAVKPTSPKDAGCPRQGPLDRGRLPGKLSLRMHWGTQPSNRPHPPMPSS